MLANSTSKLHLTMDHNLRQHNDLEVAEWSAVEHFPAFHDVIQYKLSNSLFHRIKFHVAIVTLNTHDINFKSQKFSSILMSRWCWWGRCARWWWWWRQQQWMRRGGGNIRGNNRRIRGRKIKGKPCRDPIHKRVLGTTVAGVPYIWYTNLLQTNKHIETTSSRRKWRQTGQGGGPHHHHLVQDQDRCLHGENQCCTNLHQQCEG